MFLVNKQLRKRGRPPGIRAAQLELQEKLYNHPDNHKVIETIYRSALDDNHKNQAVAQKLVMDRLLPISTFEKSVDSREKINIVINTIRPEKEPIEGEVIEQ